MDGVKVLYRQAFLFTASAPSQARECGFRGRSESGAPALEIPLLIRGRGIIYESPDLPAETVHRAKRPMRKRLTIVSALAIGLFFRPSAAPGQVPAGAFSLRISAGCGFAGFGDLNEAGKGHNARFEDLAGLWSFTKSGEIALPRVGPDFDAEILLRVARRLEIGLGGGFLSRPGRESEVAMRQASSGAGSLVRWTVAASAIPLTVNAYYRVPVSARVSGFLKAGLGCYFASLRFTSYRQSELLGVQTWDRTTSRARDVGLGFQGGLVVEYGLSRALSCFAEGTMRFVNLKDWTVEYTYSSPSLTDVQRTASCWSAEESNSDTGRDYHVFVFSDQELTGFSYQGVRKARIDFSGWSLQAGLRLRFGK